MEHKLFAVDFASSAHRSADAPVERASGSSASTGMDKNFVISAANNLQALLCLSNLTSAGADDPTKVRVYANFIEQRVQALGKLVCPMLWNSA